MCKRSLLLKVINVGEVSLGDETEPLFEFPEPDSKFQTLFLMTLV